MKFRPTSPPRLQFLFSISLFPPSPLNPLTTPLNKRLMLRHDAHAAFDRLCDAIDEAIDVFGWNEVDQRVIGAWDDALAEHDLDPTDVGEQFVGVAVETSAVAEQIDVGLKLLGDRHRSAVAP